MMPITQATVLLPRHKVHQPNAFLTMNAKDPELIGQFIAPSFPGRCVRQHCRPAPDPKLTWQA